MTIPHFRNYQWFWDLPTLGGLKESQAPTSLVLPKSFLSILLPVRLAAGMKVTMHDFPTVPFSLLGTSPDICGRPILISLTWTVMAMSAQERWWQ